MKVALFPGHVGKDSGAVDKAAPEFGDELHTVEAVVTYAIASAASEMLTRMGIDNVLAIGGWDYRLARTVDCDLGISIHADVSTNPKVRGYHVIHYPGSMQGRNLAAQLDTAMMQVSKRARSVHGRGDLFILRKTPFPCALVEAGFLSNVEEEGVLMQPGYQHRVAFALVSGILWFSM